MSFVVKRFNILFTLGFVSLDCEMNSGATVVGTGTGTGTATGAIVVDTGTGTATGATVVGTGTGMGTAFWTKP
jgi:hypothetical protein